MKKFLVIILLLFLPFVAMGQIKSVGFTTAVGHTFVDLDEAVGVTQLTDWDNVGIMIKANIDFKLSDKISLAGEAGLNRLYYWEYYWDDGYYNGYRYSSDWTTNIGIHIKTYFSDRLSLQAGPGMYIYNDGSGVVPGVAVQMAYEFPTSSNFSIPVLIRVENVMGNGFPISLMLGSGIVLNLKK